MRTRHAPRLSRGESPHAHRGGRRGPFVPRLGTVCLCMRILTYTVGAVPSAPLLYSLFHLQQHCRRQAPSIPSLHRRSVGEDGPLRRSMPLSPCAAGHRGAPPTQTPPSLSPLPQFTPQIAVLSRRHLITVNLAASQAWRQVQTPASRKSRFVLWTYRYVCCDAECFLFLCTSQVAAQRETCSDGAVAFKLSNRSCQPPSADLRTIACAPECYGDISRSLSHPFQQRSPIDERGPDWKRQGARGTCGCPAAAKHVSQCRTDPGTSPRSLPTINCGWSCGARARGHGAPSSVGALPQSLPPT